MVEKTKKTRRSRPCSVLIFEGDINVGTLKGVIGVREGGSKPKSNDEVTIIRGDIVLDKLSKDAVIGRDNRTPAQRRGPLTKSPKKEKRAIKTLRKRVKAMEI